MVEPRICYRELRKYKYQLTIEYTHPTHLRIGEDTGTVDDYVRLSKSGDLRLKKSYAWDGPSGPTVDTKNFMRGSLVHDGLYQLMRDGLLDDKTYRKDADAILRDTCKEDGMSAIRASYVYWSVRIAGGYAAKPRPRQPYACIWAPSAPPT